MTPILILEDDELVRLLVAEELRDEGWEVIEARTEQEALAVFSSRPEIATVVTDITLKGEAGGLRVVAAIREARPGCRIIVASGDSAPVPNVEFLAKPYQPSDLVALLRA